MNSELMLNTVNSFGSDYEQTFSISDNSGFLLHTESGSQYNRFQLADYKTPELVIRFP